MLGHRNVEYLAGIQTEATEFEVSDETNADWETVLAFLGRPSRARLTSFPNCQCLDLYFP